MARELRAALIALPLAGCLVVGATLIPSGRALAQHGSAAGGEYHVCGSLQNPYGPYDYRKDRDKLQVVENFHFGPLTEALIRPMEHQVFGGDFDYTLRASPNHHRALISLARYAERVKLTKLVGSRYPVECYFDRAIRFAPDDLIVRMIYAGHLGRTNRTPEAIVQLDFVSAKAGDSATTHFNAGLNYFDIKEYDKALARAHDAQRLGLQRNELRDALVRAGQWRDAAPIAAAAAASATAAAASAPKAP